MPVMPKSIVISSSLHTFVVADAVEGSAIVEPVVLELGPGLATPGNLIEDR